MQHSTTNPLLALLLGLLAVQSLYAEVITLAPGKDNTIFEESTGASNGAGAFLFAGNTAKDAARRALLAFDVAAHVPAGALITRVQLTLHMSRTTSGAHSVRLHCLSADWGESTSKANNQEGAGTAALTGDATWLLRFFDTEAWDTPGGDFAARASGGSAVDGTGFYTWPSTADLVADVQGWLDQPTANFGWILLGDEGAKGTAKRFDSRQHNSAPNRPQLTIEYTREAQNTPPVAGPVGDFNADERVDFSDFLLFVNHFGQDRTGADFDPVFDLDDDGRTDLDDFFLFVDNFGRSR